MSNAVACEVKPHARFDLGRIVATPNALSHVSHPDILNALSRHIRGDWGSLTPEDWAANDRATQQGDRLLSAYESTQHVKFWIITESDRSVTTVLLPEDY